MAEKLSEPRTVEGGRVVVDELLEGAATTARLRGYLADDPQQRRLVTLAGRLMAPVEPLRRALAMEIEGIAALEFLGPVDRPDDYAWRGACMVEVEPRGRPANELAPIGERDAAALGVQIAAVVARAHAAGQLVRGIRPELVYVDAGIGGVSRLVALVPRAPLLLDGARPASHGPPLMAHIYRAPEDQLGRAPEPRSDVFALCATLFALVTGHHPFGDRPGEQLDNLTAGSMRHYPGSPALGGVLMAALSRDPARRPDLARLVAGLRA